eukprot:997505_1
MFDLYAITALMIGLYAIRTFYFYIHRKWNQYPPGPNGLPFVGRIFSMRDPIKFNSDLAEKYGPISMAYVVQQPFFFLNSTDLIRELFANKHALQRNGVRKSFLMNYLPLDQHPSAFANHPFWKEKRKVLQSMLLSHLDSQFLNKAHNESMAAVVQNVQNCIDQGTLWYPAKDLQYVMFNAIWTAAFGSSVPPHSEMQHKITSFTARTAKQIGADVGFKHLRLDRVFKMLPSAWLKSFFSLKEYGDYIESLMYEKLGYDEKIWDIKDEKWDQHFRDVQQDQDSCLVSKIVAAYRGKTEVYTRKDGVLAEIASSLFVGGAETTKNASEYGLILLAKYPKCQGLIHEEVRNLLGDDWKQKETSFKAIANELHYLRAFVHETIRLSNVAALGIPHCTDADIWTKDGKYKIPKDSVLIPGVKVVDRSDPHWVHKTNGKPTSVCLDAWLDEKGRFTHRTNKNKMMGFSTGPRNCPGKSLALRSMYVLFIKLILNFQFELEDEHIEIKQKFAFTNCVDPAIGLSVKLR